jgi:hypothetical protein
MVLGSLWLLRNPHFFPMVTGKVVDPKFANLIQTPIG